MKIYTKTGDQGETGILGGKRVYKDDRIIDTIGEVDEVNSHLGLVVSANDDASVNSILQEIQAELFVIGSQIANCQSDRPHSVSVGLDSVARLEKNIDHYDEKLPAMTAFILPGGHSVGAQLHVSRCVCRRAERSLVQLTRQSEFDSDLSVAVTYLNRLSDLLFVLARYVNVSAERPEIQWLPNKS